MEYEPLMRGSMPEEEVFPLKGEAALAPAKSPKLKRRAAVAAVLNAASVGEGVAVGSSGACGVRGSAETAA